MLSTGPLLLSRLVKLSAVVWYFTRRFYVRIVIVKWKVRVMPANVQINSNSLTAEYSR